MMMQNALKYLKGINLSYVLNISSDAVYSDTKEPLNEHSMMAPISAHGVMHCMRERLVDHTFCDSAGHLRPTLIFGKDDPHNGYGPNSFWRKIIADEDITLFGKGEEMRDHIHISDVVSIAIEMIKCQHLGAINAATGQLRSFHDIANSMVTLRKAKCKVLTSQRHGPMPHDGYRAFDNSAARRLLPNIRFMTIENYLLSEST
jgi:nucleoside-diphosphate-sugar epimerase